MSFRFEFGDASLFNGDGRRKYLAPSETRRWLKIAKQADPATRLFCLLLYYTGCRVSEGLALTPGLIDLETNRVAFRTLKRRKCVYRAVPVPAPFLRELRLLANHRKSHERIFRWSRTTAWRRIKALMARAGVAGPQATMRGLRHRFGVHAITSGVGEDLLRRMLGHAPNSKSTRIYLNAMGDEERAIIRRMWKAE